MGSKCGRLGSGSERRRRGGALRSPKPALTKTSLTRRDNSPKCRKKILNSLWQRGVKRLPITSG